MKTGETLSEFKQRKNSFFVILIYISSILGLFALHYPSLIFLEIYTYLFLSDFSLKFLLQTSFFVFNYILFSSAAASRETNPFVKVSLASDLECPFISCVRAYE